MRGKLGASIENKILVPFVCISLITVLCFCFILYRTEYSVKIRTETVNAQALVQYINADIDAGGYWTNPWDLVEKYAATYQGDSLFLYTARDEPLFSRRDLGDAELVLADSQDNRLGWRVLYSLDRNALRLEFIEEQRYMILAAVAMLLVIVQASVVIAYNISAPIRQLSKMCTLVSRNPGGSEDLAVEYTGRRDEAGQLAAAFQSMMENVRSYTQALNRIKTLNESIVANLPLGVAVYDLDGRVIFQNLRADGMLSHVGEEIVFYLASRVNECLTKAEYALLSYIEYTGRGEQTACPIDFNQAVSNYLAVRRQTGSGWVYAFEGEGARDRCLAAYPQMCAVARAMYKFAQETEEFKEIAGTDGPGAWPDPRKVGR